MNTEEFFKIAKDNPVCMLCASADVKRTKDKMIRCTRFSFWVDPLNMMCKFGQTNSIVENQRNKRGKRC